VARLSAFGSRALPAGFAVAGRLSAQYSPDALIPGEQIGLGGASSIRGYREREVAGDQGLLFNLEALGPDLGPAFGADGVRLRPLAFFDYGRVANHNDTPCARSDTSCSLAGAGLGVRFNYGKRVSARLDVARALREGTLTGSGSTRGHFALNLVF
jgi:hemolysin activation/secretion protein